MQALYFPIPTNIKPSLPPMYIWPQSLKRTILVLATVACLGAYLLLAGGLVGAGFILLEILFG